MLPKWLAPRTGNGVRRFKEYLPINSGVNFNNRSKEHMWAGHFDKDFGEFYRKMSTG